ncbi:hypothetical protein [Chitinophaga pinensis]|uniref:Uncharacterized protein n=1 Tax=Chitinophaga pinensis (strain ATCC 43595 / DSM 2588 / LMG 13176 / NBRC 15968 / NCIMB 11800 / UQM 2034) TaxID=485918 RepID=A0A979GZR9_CHIPD|nr:hypothetical protein [Chitinophaga pinensis]ACU64219.1 hypothetical protein Cpin_6818 [Chitinophaga pinensis DSM 2588]
MSAAKIMKAGQFVDNKHVSMLRENYRENRWRANSERLGKPDSLSVWYSLDELKQYIETAEAAGADGIRVYFGAYPSVFPENVLLEDRQTIAFVATQQKASQTGKTENKDMYVSTPNGPEIIAFNFGLPCPPYCTGDPKRPVHKIAELQLSKM